MDADCYALPMISIGTFQDLHDQNHTLGLYCISCDRWHVADLAGLIQAGRVSGLCGDGLLAAILPAYYQGEVCI